MILWVFWLPTFLLSMVCGSVSAEHKITEDDSVVHCVFPFKYKEETYHSCSNIFYESEHGQCGTSENINIGRRFRNCTVFDGVNGAKTYKNGCVFPFVYNGTIHNDCISEGYKTTISWCSLTNNYDRDGLNRTCFAPKQRLQLIESNLPCKFPFKVYWKWYNTCAGYNIQPEDGYFGRCSISGNVNIDKTLRECTQFDWPTNSLFQTFTSFGCTFPFLYQREVQNDCIFETVNNTRISWCSLTNNYDRDGERTSCWGGEEHIPVEDDSEVPCVFPFKYKEETYHQCSNIFYESEHGQCGTSKNINVERRIRNCTVYEDDRTPGVPYPTGCVFPFLYEGILRNDCIFEDGDDDGWCSRTNNYDRNRRRIQCWKKGNEITEEFDTPCVFPFIFKNTTYYYCQFLWKDLFTEHGHCGTTANMNVDRRFKYCNYFETLVTNSTSGYSECVFPFLYEQQEINDCIFDESNHNGWCSGTNNYDRDQIKKPCWKTTDVEGIKEAADTPCFHPFQYKDKWYNKCINMFGESPYGQCGTTYNVNVDRRYRDCSFFEEPRGTPGPSGCVFPFLFQGKAQNTCIYTNEEPAWCSATNNYDRDSVKILCWKEGDQLTESPESSACIFPFKYKNETYENCTAIVSSSEYGQCATESNDINVGRAYKNCTQFDPISLNTIVEDYDVPCHFPFTFKNRIHRECTRLFQDTKYGQCATTSNLDRDRKYRNCTNAIGCHFPFVYQNETYNDCIFNGVFYNGWCSRTDNYDRDGLKKRCYDYGYWKKFIKEYEDTSTAECHFPFIYKNRVLNGCINHMTPGQNFICATTSNLNRDRKFKFCNQEEIRASLASGANSDIIINREMDTYTGKICIFPFRYKGVWFYECTTQYHKDQRSWCATRKSGSEYTDFDLCLVEENTVISTYGGNGNGANCHFPFHSQWGTKEGCIQGARGYWCATTSDYTTDNLWGYCNMKNTDTELKNREEERGASGLGETIFSGTCQFPFTWDDKEYYGCYEDSSSLMWCKTTTGSWGRCGSDSVQTSITTEKGVPATCSFPYVYRNKLHSTPMTDCVTGKKSCSTTANYDRDRQRIVYT